MGAGASTGARGGRAEGSGALGPAALGGAGGAAEGDLAPGVFIYPVRAASDNLKVVSGRLPPVPAPNIPVFLSSSSYFAPPCGSGWVHVRASPASLGRRLTWGGPPHPTPPSCRAI